MMHMAQFKTAIRCACYSPAGDVIAIGLKSGGFYIIEANTLKVLAKKRDCSKSLTQIK